jgi:hypothetical protein
MHAKDGRIAEIVLMNAVKHFHKDRHEPLAVTRIIIAREEDGVAVVAALDHMQGLTWNEITPEPRHEAPPSR